MTKLPTTTRPNADFITGNPPFTGAGPMRLTLGDGYVEALRGAWPEAPERADFVMFWRAHAARAARHGTALWLYHHQQFAADV